MAGHYTLSGPCSAAFREGDIEKWLLSINHWSNPSPQKALVATKSDASVSCHLPLLPSSQASCSSQVLEERHFGAHHTPLWLFIIVLQCCWELLEMWLWPEWQQETNILKRQCPKNDQLTLVTAVKNHWSCAIRVYKVLWPFTNSAAKQPTLIAAWCLNTLLSVKYLFCFYQVCTNNTLKLVLYPVGSKIRVLLHNLIL